MPRQRAFSPAAAPAFDQPLSELNITPLIDVMLVLLVMMILTLPTVLHKVPVDLPQGYAPPAETVTHPLMLARFKALDADRKAMLVMRTDPEARYGRFDQMLAEVKRVGITRLGFAGNEAMME